MPLGLSWSVLGCIGGVIRGVLVANGTDKLTELADPLRSGEKRLLFTNPKPTTQLPNAPRRVLGVYLGCIGVYLGCIGVY